MEIEKIKKELEYVFNANELKTFLGKPISESSEEIIRMKFNEYASTNSKKIKIKDLIENYQEKSFLIATPDGYNEVGDFYIKHSRPIYDITTEFDFKTKCSEDHKFETMTEWKFAKELTQEDFLLTLSGYQRVVNITKCINEVVYDFEVKHDNHRYWSGTGISSHNTGKTFIALSICREAQMMGYTPIYFDTEGAIDLKFVSKIGVDPAKLRHEPIATIEEFATYMAKLNETFFNMKKEGKIPPKVIVVLDSLGNLSSNKEKTDTTEGNDKRDMTKQQAIRRTFRVVGNDCAMNGIPCIYLAHTYAVIGCYFPSNTIAGGGGLKYNASIIFMLSKSKMEDKEAEEIAKSKNVEKAKVGIIVTVTPNKNRFAKPIKVQFHIPFYKPINKYVGLENFVSWENCGVVRGKALTEKEHSKLSPAEQKTCHEFSSLDGKLLFALPKETARTLVCKHLGGEIPLIELFTAKVFTDEVLRELDDKVIKKTFELPDVNSHDDILEMTEELERASMKDDTDNDAPMVTNAEIDTSFIDALEGNSIEHFKD